MQRFDILSIGAVVQDTFVRPSRLRVVTDVDSETGQSILLPLGAKNNIDAMQHTVGGGAANSAVTFSRVGLQAATVSRVGKDIAGRSIKEVLEKEGVSPRFIVTDEELQTGESVLFLAPDGNRTIFTYRGPAAKFTMDDVDESIIRRADWIYMSSVGGNLQILKHVFALCRIHEVKLAWNPGGAELAHGKEKLRPLLAAVDVLIMNREEAARLTEIPHGSVEEVLAEMLKLVKKGIVVVTNGAEGATAFDGEHVESLPGRNVKVVDATGAGDAFGSGFVAAHMSGLPVDRALSFAVSNAESVISKIGAQAGILGQKELETVRTVRGIKYIETAALEGQ